MDKLKTILVIEDDTVLMAALGERLREDYLVVSARTGEEGLASIKVKKPDLVLLDLMLPEMSGEQVLKEMKEQSSTRDIPVIVLSAKGDDATVINCLNCLGATDYLVKSHFSLDEVAKKIERNL